MAADTGGEQLKICRDFLTARGLEKIPEGSTGSPVGSLKVFSRSFARAPSTLPDQRYVLLISMQFPESFELNLPLQLQDIARDRGAVIPSPLSVISRRPKHLVLDFVISGEKSELLSFLSELRKLADPDLTRVEVLSGGLRVLPLRQMTLNRNFLFPEGTHFRGPSLLELWRQVNASPEPILVNDPHQGYLFVAYNRSVVESLLTSMNFYGTRKNHPIEVESLEYAAKIWNEIGHSLMKPGSMESWLITDSNVETGQEILLLSIPSFVQLQIFRKQAERDAARTQTGAPEPVLSQIWQCIEACPKPEPDAPKPKNTRSIKSEKKGKSEDSSTEAADQFVKEFNHRRSGAFAGIVKLLNGTFYKPGALRREFRNLARRMNLHHMSLRQTENKIGQLGFKKFDGVNARSGGRAPNLRLISAIKILAEAHASALTRNHKKVPFDLEKIHMAAEFDKFVASAFPQK